MKAKPKPVPLFIRLDPALRERLAIRAAEWNISMNQLVTEFITFGLDELEREAPRTVLRRARPAFVSEPSGSTLNGEHHG